MRGYKLDLLATVVAGEADIVNSMSASAKPWKPSETQHWLNLWPSAPLCIFAQFTLFRKSQTFH